MRWEKKEDRNKDNICSHVYFCAFPWIFIYSWSLPVTADMRIAHLSLEMHQFRWAASWLQQRPRGGGGGGRGQYMILWNAYARLDLEDQRTSCTGRRWNEMRLRHGTVATAIVFFTSFLSLSWYTAWQNGKGEFISENHSVMLYHTIASASFIQKFNKCIVIQ